MPASTTAGTGWKPVLSARFVCLHQRSADFLEGRVFVVLSLRPRSVCHSCSSTRHHGCHKEAATDIQEPGGKAVFQQNFVSETGGRLDLASSFLGCCCVLIQKLLLLFSRNCRYLRKTFQQLTLA